MMCVRQVTPNVDSSTLRSPCVCMMCVRQVTPSVDSSTLRSPCACMMCVRQVTPSFKTLALEFVYGSLNFIPSVEAE